jgi:hypothetical protein
MIGRQDFAPRRIRSRNGGERRCVPNDGLMVKQNESRSLEGNRASAHGVANGDESSVVISAGI